MKRIKLLSFGLLLSTAIQAQNDPILMKVNGKDITRSEFEYSFNKNNAEGVLDKKSVEEYADLFVNYKLKVAAAEEARLDTLTSFQTEFRSYRDQQLRPYLADSLAEEREIQNYYDRLQQSIGGRGLIHPAHILVMVRQKATPSEQNAAKARIDSIYAVLQAGGDFAEVAKNCSDDKRTAINGGLLPWIGPNQTLKEFENEAYALQAGEMSHPFLSTAGYHIILMKERKPLENYAELRPQIKMYLEQRGLGEKVINDRIEARVKASNGSLTAQDVMDEIDREVEASDPAIKNLVREYHDGLLLYEISNRTVWDKAAKDEPALEKYYKKNKKKYKFDAPRYKGIVYYCKDEADVKRVKTVLKGTPYESWMEKLRLAFNNDSTVRIKVDKGLFKEGDNANVDKLVFKKNTGKAMQGFPHTAVCGKLLKKKPESYTDVKGLVTADYQNELEQDWVKGLRKKYKVEIYEDVLKTVNNHPYE